MIKKDENKFNISRRSFLRTAALTGAAFCASPVINKTEAAEKKSRRNQTNTYQYSAYFG